MIFMSHEILVLQQKSRLAIFNSTEIINGKKMENRIVRGAIYTDNKHYHCADRMQVCKKKEMSVEVFVSTREKRKTDAVTPAALRDFPEGSVHGQMVREWGCWDWEKQMNLD